MSADTVAVHARNTRQEKRSVIYGLWILQSLLAALFLFAGGMKLILPVAVLTSMGSPNSIHLPGLFLRFIGIAEVLGAIGLIVPGTARIARYLTPLAAAGLVIIMMGATILTLAMDPAAAIVPFAIGSLLSFVAVRRRRSDEYRFERRSRRSLHTLRPAATGF